MEYKYLHHLVLLLSFLLQMFCDYCILSLTELELSCLELSTSDTGLDSETALFKTPNACKLSQMEPDIGMQ